MFFSFLDMSLYTSGTLLPKVLFMFIFKNFPISLTDSFMNKSEFILLLQMLISTSMRLPIEGDLYSHFLHI